jgi:hypothetical protein
MPTITVDKAALFKELEREYTTEEFDELCSEHEAGGPGAATTTKD